MPVTKSAKKALRRDRRRAVVNLRIKRRVRAAIKEYRQKPSQKGLDLVYSFLDRAAKKNVFHRNKSSRLKSRLTKALKAPRTRIVGQTRF